MRELLEELGVVEKVEEVVAAPCAFAIFSTVAALLLSPACALLIAFVSVSSAVCEPATRAS